MAAFWIASVEHKENKETLRIIFELGSESNETEVDDSTSPFLPHMHVQGVKLLILSVSHPLSLQKSPDLDIQAS